MDCPLRWDALGEKLNGLLYDLLEGARRSAASRRDLEFVSLVEAYFALEHLGRLKLDEVSRHVAEYGNIPSRLSDDEAFFLSLRIRSALDFLGMLFPAQATASPFDDPGDGWTDEEVCKWLLCELWYRRFDHWMKLDALAARGSFPFYGLEPAVGDENS